MKKFLVAFLFCALTMSFVSMDGALAAADDKTKKETRTTRDLVFEDEDDASATTKTDDKKQTLALKSTIVLIRDGKTSTVVPSHEFVSGDRIKLVFTPNADGFVYWLTKGSSGNYSVLFPSKNTSEDNSVKRNQEYTIPTKGTFKFDNKPGKEELLCILSTERLPDIDKIIDAATALQNITNNMQANADKKLGAQDSKAGDEKRTTRDLVFEDEDEGDVNTKTQSVEKGKPMVTHFVLTHK